MRPFLARPVAIELDPVPLGVGEVERLADEVVGRAAQVPARIEDSAERAGEVGPGRDEERQVEQPRRPRRPDGCVGCADELDERAVGRSDRADAVVGRQGAEPDRALVEIA
jgi:hypothetical protein